MGEYQRLGIFGRRREGLPATWNGLSWVGLIEKYPRLGMQWLSLMGLIEMCQRLGMIDRWWVLREVPAIWNGLSLMGLLEKSRYQRLGIIDRRWEGVPAAWND